jgi:uncharacterized integral membrane protein
MLSREHAIHRSPGEERVARRRVDVATRTSGDSVPGAWIWTKIIVLVLGVVLLATFVLLNRDSVVEPRVHLLVASYERPGLLMVMLLTAAFSAAGALLVRTVLATVRQLRARPSVATPSVQAIDAKAPALSGAPSSL